MAHRMNMSIWECDFWSKSPSGELIKCVKQQITSDLYTDTLPDGWLGVVLSTHECGDSEYMLMCPDHAEPMIEYFGGSYVVWGAA